jgi:excisionase family DNA binding protein
MSDATLESGLLTIDEAARLLRLKPSTIRDWLYKRRIAFVKLGGRVFLRRGDVESLIAQSIIPAHTPAIQDDSCKTAETRSHGVE